MLANRLDATQRSGTLQRSCSIQIPINYFTLPTFGLKIFRAPWLCRIFGALGSRLDDFLSKDHRWAGASRQ